MTTAYPVSSIRITMSVLAYVSFAFRMFVGIVVDNFDIQMQQTNLGPL